MQAPLYFTDKAIEQIKKLRLALNIQEDQYLRIGVKGSGIACAGVTQVIAFDKQTDKDELYSIQGIDVLIRKGESMYVVGMKVDYVDEGNSKGFVFLA